MSIKNEIKKMIIRYRFGKEIDYHMPLSIHEEVNLQNVKFGKYCQVAHHAEIANSSIGDRTSIGRYTKIQSAILGKFCSISWNVTIGATSHPLDRLSTHAFSYRKQFGIVDHDIAIKKDSVLIGNDVWIGCDVVIMPGVTIGDGAVIGAGSIVTKDVEPYSIIVGNPGKKIKNRFSVDIIEELQEIQWWDFKETDLKMALPLMQESLTMTTIQQLKNIK
ncbi:CatB-related O-acetyltransferase [Aerococcus sp. NPDC058936]|uniref:CatB-related O-acetyltransferase n=1 Tax=Aerococcus sp. NPDC058936 TaxID=3346674 RepID=UPI00366A66C2